MADDNLDLYYPPTSKAWYLLPIFLGIVGGVIAWFALRNKNPPQARKMLVVGAAVFGAFVALVTVAMYLDETAPMLEGNPDDNDVVESQSLNEEPSEVEDAEAQLANLPKGAQLLINATLAYAELLDTVDPTDTTHADALQVYMTGVMIHRINLIDPGTHMLHDATEDTCRSLEGAAYTAFTAMDFDRLYEVEDLSHLSDSEFYDLMTQRSLSNLELPDSLYPLVYDNIEAWDKLYVYLADAYNDSGCQQYN